MRIPIGLTAATLVATLAGCSAEGRADAAPAQLWHEAAAAQHAAPVNIPVQSSLAPLIKQLKPAVVNISTETVTKNPHRGLRRGHPGQGGGQGGGDPWEQFFEQYFGAPREMPDELRGQSLGSGFIINAEGFVLTNNHVIKDATDIKVRLPDNREFTAKVVGKDAPLDVALLKLEDVKGQLPTVSLGDSDALEQGDFVLALGNPFGLHESASFGIVSAKDRAIGAGTYDDFIQTDAAINPGNSGGPLFNLRGEVIGINTAIVSPQIGQGIGFAVPINLAKQILPQLEAKGKVARGYLGVSVQDLSPEMTQAFGLPPNTRGALVQQVMPKAPAAKAGVKEGDVVVGLNGKPVESSGQLTRSVAIIPPGGKANLTILRNGTKKDLPITVTQRPENEEALARGELGQGEESEGEGHGEDRQGRREGKLGVRLGELTPEIAREIGVQGDTGVVVGDVVEGGAAERAGVRRGDIILEVNRQPVAKPQQVAEIVGKMKPGDIALLRIRRGPNAFFAPVRIGGEKK